MQMVRLVQVVSVAVVGDILLLALPVKAQDWFGCGFPIFTSMEGSKTLIDGNSK